MDENYIGIVRKSLYGKPEKNKVNSTYEMPRKAKEIKFSLQNYDSETVFKSKVKSEKIENRQSTPFKKRLSKKRKAKVPLNSDTSFEEESNGILQNLKNRKATPFKNKMAKKRKLVLSFSSTESFEEDLKDNLLSPSKSELENFQSTFKNLTNNNTDEFEDSTESEESVDDFNLDIFFNNYEPSCNESITEAHSGIDNEFESECVRDAKIIGSDLFLCQNAENHSEEEMMISTTEETIKNIRNEVTENSDNVIEISDEVNTISDDSTEHNISEVVTKIQNTVILNDEDDNEETNPVVVSESLDLRQEEYSLEYNAADYYDLEDWKLVILKPFQSICVYGLLTLKVLHGTLDVLGSILDKNSNEINLYSPRGSALLQIKNITATENSGEVDINEILSALTTDKIIDSVFEDQKTAILKCTKLEDFQILLVEKYISQQIFPKIDEYNLPQAIFEPTGNWNIITGSYSWDEILSNITFSTKLMLTGGKGVGKSTFLRFAINRLLNTFDKVRVIDLDPGQSEFFVPGCISVVTVTDPIFGPTYTHLKATDRSILSNINVGHDPATFIKCVKSLMTYAQGLEECPTLINYMGFTQGIGLDIISSAITYIQPTDIVEIHSRSRKKNFTEDLTFEVVKENCNLFGSSSVTLNYNLHRVRAMNDNNDGWSLEPRQAREMCVLAYFCQMMSKAVGSLLSCKLPMYEIKLSAIKVTNPQREEIPPATVNANLVALCSLDEDSDVFVCLGYGVVRGIDLESDTLVLLTPEVISVLEKVSYLVLGSVMLPPSVYMTPDDVKGNIPYVMAGELVSLGQITKRTYLPANKK